MNETRESFLVESLKHVSLQRLRNLKMDMDKLAKDSRINNERTFWSLLEHHSIRLDERTRKDFYGQVADNKGIDIKHALKCLKNAQRKTGRDSVEVLKKQETIKPPEVGQKAPEATSVQTITPKIPQHNYKLDKLRSSALRIGKLRLSMKTGNDEKAKPDQLQPETSQKNQPLPNFLARTKENATNKSIDKISIEELEAGKTEAESNPEPFLKMLLTSDETNVDKSTETNTNNSRSEKVIAERSKKFYDGPNKDNNTAKHEKSKDYQTKTSSSTLNEKEATTELTDLWQKEIQSNQMENKSQNEASKIGNAPDANHQKLVENSSNNNENSEKDLKRVEKNYQNKVGSNLNQTLLNGENEADVEAGIARTPLLDDSQNDNESNSTTVVSLSEHNSSADSNENKQENLAIQLEQNSPDEQNSSTKPDATGSSLDFSCLNKQQNHLAKNVSNDNSGLTDETESTKESSATTDEKDRNTVAYDQELFINDETKQVLEESNEDKVDDKEILQEDNKTKIDDDLMNRATDTSNRDRENTISNSANLYLSPNTATAISHKQIKQLCNAENQANEPELTEPNVIDELKGEKSVIRENVSDKVQISTKKQENYFMEDRSTKIKKPSDENLIHRKQKKKSRTELNSDDNYSVSTISSEEDEELTLDEILNNNDSTQSVSEEVKIGEFTLQFTAPPWLNNNKRSGNDVELKTRIQMDWIYGCNTNFNQPMTTSRAGELIYFVGGVIVVYDHNRRCQRLYLEHSAPVTSVTAHAHDDLIASAQAELLVSKSTNQQGAESDSSFGRIHVRVWNCVHLETMRIIGTTSLRHPVYKMAFLNVQGFFVTIEHDESGTMTLWDGGCRITSRNSKHEEPLREGLEDEQPTQKKRFVPTRLRSSFNLLTQTKAGKQDKPSTKFYGARCIAGNLTKELCFASGGKYHLSFWRLNESHSDESHHDFATGRDGLDFSEPEHGDFGKHFFRAEYISTCVATTKFMEGCVITGDSNGTLLLWPESSKVAAKGFSHAHECAISSICVSDEGHIFTCGVRDRRVRAFYCRKSKVENCGSIEIPLETGSATCLVCINKSLFVSTEKNVILSVLFESKPIESVASSAPVKANLPFHLAGRVSASTNLSARSLSQNGEHEMKDPKTGIFSSWDQHEVARGFQKGVHCAIPFNRLKAKKRHRNIANKSHELVSMPGVQESIKILRGNQTKIGRMKRSVSDVAKVSSQTSAAKLAWNLSDVPENKEPRQPMFSASSPKLKTNDRIKQRELNEERDRLRATPMFALHNYVTKSEVFLQKDPVSSSSGSLFITASMKGQLLIHSPHDHRIHGRYRLHASGDITCMDVCERRHLVVVGTSTGCVIAMRINANDFEVLPSFKFVFSGLELPGINLLKLSPSGLQLAAAAGNDVIICSVRRLKIVECGRLSGHQSNRISSISWSKRKYSGGYLLKTCSIEPAPQIKIWLVKSLMEQWSEDLLHRVEWSSCAMLDYCSKGIWQNYPQSSNVTATTTCDIKTHNQTKKFIKNLSESAKHDVEALKLVNSGVRQTNSMLIVGDRDGFLSFLHHPCLNWNQSLEKTQRIHYSQIRSVNCSQTDSIIYSTADQDSSVVQWKVIDEKES